MGITNQQTILLKMLMKYKAGKFTPMKQVTRRLNYWNVVFGQKNAEEKV